MAPRRRPLAAGQVPGQPTIRSGFAAAVAALRNQPLRRSTAAQGSSAAAVKTEDDIEPGRKVNLEAGEAAEGSSRVKRQKLNADTLNADTTITVKADEDLAVSDQKIKVETDEATAPLPTPQSRKNAASANAEPTTDASSLPISSFNNEQLANVIKLNEITSLETEVTLPVLQEHGWHVAAAADHIFRHGHEETATETAASAFTTPARVKAEPTELMTPTSRLAELSHGIVDLTQERHSSSAIITIDSDTEEVVIPRSSENTTIQTTIAFMLPGERMTARRTQINNTTVVSVPVHPYITREHNPTTTWDPSAFKQALNPATRVRLLSHLRGADLSSALKDLAQWEQAHELTSTSTTSTRCCCT